MSDFDINYKNIRAQKDEIIFDIIGNKNNGLDKSIINSLRRILLTQINTISFDINNIYIDKNTSSMHNEFLKDRISLIPLYIDPDTYDYSYIFEIKIKNTNDPILKIKSSNFIIYPLNENGKYKIQNQKQILLDGGVISESDDIYKLIKENPKEYFNMDQPISDKEKEIIIKPTIIRNKKYFIDITELKLTNSDVNIQELNLYCIPIQGIGIEHAKFNNISKSIYTFKKNKKLFEEEFKKYSILNKIPEKNLKKEKNTFEIEKSERYFYRDVFNEPYYYEFTIKSNHFYNPYQLFKISIDILMNDLNNFKNKINRINKEEDYTIATIENFKNPNTYQMKIQNETHNILSIIQNYAVRYHINDDSFILVMGYKQYHILDNIMLINLMIKPNDYEEIQKINFIIEFINNIIDNINKDLNIMKNKWNY